jgi:hypothetical protein
MINLFGRLDAGLYLAAGREAVFSKLERHHEHLAAIPQRV